MWKHNAVAEYRAECCETHYVGFTGISLISAENARRRAADLAREHQKVIHEYTGRKIELRLLSRQEYDALPPWERGRVRADWKTGGES